ncbi:MAG: DegV family protein [Solobacterium sp.]|nr:DegV family protein [Solobacterium sp.]MDY2732707.1 DegV family protein [Erysipelotrichaceae bacterium]MCI7732494.1 DegV family protein [Solobacterium sp.]MDD6497860.1 DegV family protein [Solobacterium sp.]MDD6886687.1 DegV family protein [Solobacterium sp.]
MKTAIMTDTNSGINKKEADELGIFLLPMPVIVKDKTYLEGIDISLGEMYEIMEDGIETSTSQPSPGSLMEMWDDILEEYDEVVHIPMTSGLSGSCENARGLARGYKGRVIVVDNHRISVPQRESVLEAKKMADMGKNGQEIAEYLEESGKDSSIYITVSDLKYLQRSGRLGSTSAFLGSLLNIKPILTIQGEKIDAFAKCRGIKLCERKMIEALENDINVRFKDVPKENIQVVVAGTLKEQDEIDEWTKAVQEAFPYSRVYYNALPCSILSHAGPGCKGLGAVVKKY